MNCTLSYNTDVFNIGNESNPSLVAEVSSSLFGEASASLNGLASSSLEAFVSPSRLIAAFNDNRVTAGGRLSSVFFTICGADITTANPLILSADNTNIPVDYTTITLDQVNS